MMTYSRNTLIGCYYDGYGAAINIVQILKGQEYYILEDWCQSTPTSFERVINKCDEFFHQEINKSNQKVEIFINPLDTLEKTLSRTLKAHSSPVRVVSIQKDEAFMVISSLLVEQKISLASQVLGLEKELKYFDPLSANSNHRVYALFNSVAQAEFDRLTLSRPRHSVQMRVRSTIHSRCPSLFFSDET